jgi:hypothetical protein
MFDDMNLELGRAVRSNLEQLKSGDAEESITIGGTDFTARSDSAHRS